MYSRLHESYEVRRNSGTAGHCNLYLIYERTMLSLCSQIQWRVCRPLVFQVEAEPVLLLFVVYIIGGHVELLVRDRTVQAIFNSPPSQLQIVPAIHMTSLKKEHLQMLGLKLLYCVLSNVFDPSVYCIIASRQVFLRYVYDNMDDKVSILHHNFHVGFLYYDFREASESLYPQLNNRISLNEVEIFQKSLTSSFYHRISRDNASFKVQALCFCILLPRPILKR